MHIIIWLQPDGPRTADKIDSYISAQLPDPLLDRVGYDSQKKWLDKERSTFTLQAEGHEIKYQL